MLHIVPAVVKGQLSVYGSNGAAVKILDASGTEVKLTLLEQNDARVLFEASALTPWTVKNPVLYTAVCGEEKARFGYVEYAAEGNDRILVNGKPVFLRGGIRGIVAHEHPNMTGGTKKEAAEKYIRQAKKYGFNLVRFHSTVPDPEFVEAADELGYLIHAEIGFSYEFGADGSKTLSMSNTAWEETLLKYRNSPSMAIFCIGNEMHNSGHYEQVRKLYEQGRELAPGKLIMDNSGWGEYDRGSADIFSQHIAYYHPFKRHAAMFENDNCWRMNGSATDEPLETAAKGTIFTADVRREAVPRRPVLAHEAVHYIDIPDYEKLSAKFDAFAARVGAEYLAANGIKKPKFMTELPALIKAKGLQEKFPEYIAASQVFRQECIKRYIETLRFSKIRGFEMLQFADCLKYENKNGIVDCFDDDKDIDPVWMRQFTDDAALLAKFGGENFRNGQPVTGEFYLSNFSDAPEKPGTFRVYAEIDTEKELVYEGKNFYPVPGLQKLCAITFRFPGADKTRIVRISVEFTSEVLQLTNSWEFRLFPRTMLKVLPSQQLYASASFAELLADRSAGLKADSGYIVTDRLSPEIFARLREGKTVLALYHRDDPGNTYYFPGALERYKPCIWDRGSNLGGVITDPALRAAMGGRRYFDAAMQPLLEGGYKLNLDHFPGKAMDELLFGADKPARDRMQGLVAGHKDFRPDDTLRDFCHTGALRVGKGKLVICTLNRHRCDDCGAAEFFVALVNRIPELAVKAEISEAQLKSWLEAATAAPMLKEDIMNHFWELDNKPVEDNLFWEENHIDLAKLI